MSDAPRCVILADHMWKTQATVQATGDHFNRTKAVVLSEVNETVHGLLRGQVRSDLYLKRNAQPLLKAGELMIQRAPKGDEAGTLNRIRALLSALEELGDDDSLVIDESTLPGVGRHVSRLRKEYRGHGGR